MPHTRRDGPLDGLKVLDLSTVIMGPYASQLLADMGADVIKVESEAGDPLRYYLPQRSHAMSGMFLSVHRNKRSVVLDLKTDAGRAALHALVRSADVVLHNFRPKVAQRLGLSYETLREHNQAIIVCKAYGYGEGGPNVDRPAYDDVIQASSGMAALFGKSQGEPKYVPAMVADKTVGIMIATAILAAAYAREKHGAGDEVEVPMFETMVTFNMVENLSAGAFEPPLAPMGWARSVSPMRKPFRTRDGYMCLLPYSDQNWRDFFSFVGHEDLTQHDRYRTLAQRAAHIDDLYRVVEACAPRYSNQEWINFCEAHGIPGAPVNELEDLWEEPQIVASGLAVQADHPTEGKYRAWRCPVRFGNQSWRIRRHAPHLGEHTYEVLHEAGLSDKQIEAISAQNIKAVQ